MCKNSITNFNKVYPQYSDNNYLIDFFLIPSNFYFYVNIFTTTGQNYNNLSVFTLKISTAIYIIYANFIYSTLKSVIVFNDYNKSLKN